VDGFLTPECQDASTTIKPEESSCYRFPMDDAHWTGVISKLRSELVEIMGSGEIRAMAEHIRDAIFQLDAPMSRYCEITCPSCDDVCCHWNEVFYNRTDVIYMIAAGIEIPSGQTRTTPHQACRYLSQNGCKLPRACRPYVCVWFLCDAQMEIFREEPALFQRDFISLLQMIRQYRLSLESLYESHFPMGGLWPPHPESSESIRPRNSKRYSLLSGRSPCGPFRRR